MSDKPQTNMPGSGYGTDENDQRQQRGGQQSGGMRQQYSTNQYGNDQYAADRSEQQEGEDQDGGQSGQGGQLRPALQRARHALEEGVERQAQQLQERALNTGEQISGALGAAANALSDEQSWLAGPAQDLAQSVQRLTARGLGSPAEMKQRVTDFARRHPAWTLAGAVAIGFAAARFLKATGSDGGSGRSGEYRYAGGEDEDEGQEQGLAERPDAVRGADTGERFHG